jgi:hypothetical protein
VDKIILGIFILLIGAIGVGIFIALLPIFLFILGFVLMLGLLALIGRFVTGLF